MTNDTIDADDESPLNGTVVSDTTPPTAADHGFLEQWSTLTQESLSELVLVCGQGLTPEERLIMFRVGFRLIMLAAEGATDETFKDHPEFQKELEEMALQLGV